MAFFIISQTTTPMQEAPVIRYDQSYMKTVPGLLKAAEAVVSLLGYICLQTIFWAAYRSAGAWYSFVAMTGFWVSLHLWVFYLFHIVERFNAIPWLIIETGFSATWTAFYFIAACVAVANGSYDPGWGAAAFFAFLAMVIFGYEAFIKYRKWKSGENAQGDGRPVENVAQGIPATGLNPPSYAPTGPSYPKY